uniref:Uncharacterized protein n=1 Tax=Avena sativa TaxID=4498 RepID=A0ACD5ZLC8_AVESA
MVMQGIYIWSCKGYLALEASYGRSSFKSDIYSLGVMIVEILTGSKHYQSVDQVLENLREGLVKDDAFSSRENKYQQVRTWMEIGYNCMENDADKRPTAFEIIQLLDKTENANYYFSSGHAPPLWQSGDEELNLLDTVTIEQEQDLESIAKFYPSYQELADLNMNGEMITQEHDQSDLVSELPTSADLAKLKFLEKITDGFSHEKLVGNDGTFEDFRKAFVYKGTISGRTMIAVKRLIGVGTKATKFEREAKHLMSLHHKNIVTLIGYCHDESREHKLVQFKGRPLPQDRGKEPEQLLCYEYMQNGSLHEYLTGQGYQDLDWPMRYELIKGTCEGLHYLHECLGDGQIVHLNLTPSNVLLDKNYVPHITGFDISRLIGQNRTNSVLFELKGQIRYLPRDFLNPTGTDTDLAPVDIYSLGLMILEIATRQEIDEQETFIKSVRDNWREVGQIASLYTSLGPDKLRQVKLCIDIGLDCVKPKPEKRPTAGTC